jgi:hypothetical protein
MSLVAHPVDPGNDWHGRYRRIAGPPRDIWKSDGPRGTIQHRRASQICRSERVAGCDIIGPHIAVARPERITRRRPRSRMIRSQRRRPEGIVKLNLMADHRPGVHVVGTFLAGFSKSSAIYYVIAARPRPEKTGSSARGGIGIEPTGCRPRFRHSELLDCTYDTFADALNLSCCCKSPHAEPDRRTKAIAADSESLEDMGGGD